MDRLPTIHQKYGLYRGGKPLRIDHFNCFSPDVQASVDFYNAIGFRITEYTESEDNGQLWAAWMHRRGGVHDVALTHGSGPRLHHVAFWFANPLNVIDLLDLMATTGYVSNIERGPGRHGISNAFFLYVRDPDGHRIEIYCSDYLTIDPDHSKLDHSWICTLSPDDIGTFPQPVADATGIYLAGDLGFGQVTFGFDIG